MVTVIDCVRSRHDLPKHLIRMTEENREKFRSDRLCSSRDLKLRPTEYKAGIIIITPRHWLSFHHGSGESFQSTFVKCRVRENFSLSSVLSFHPNEI
jgi:hypothetical protein